MTHFLGMHPFVYVLFRLMAIESFGGLMFSSFSNKTRAQAGFGNTEVLIAVAGCAVYVALVVPGLLRRLTQARGDLAAILMAVLYYSWPVFVLPLFALGLAWREQRREGEPMSWRRYTEQLLLVTVLATLLAALVGALWFLGTLLRSLF